MRIQKDSFGSIDKAYEKTLALLLEAASSLSATHDIKIIEAAIIAEAARIFDSNAVWMLLYDCRDDRLKMHRYWGPEKHLFKDISIHAGVGIAGKVFSTQKPEIIDPVPDHPAVVSFGKPLDVDAPAIIMYPLTAGKNRLGVLGFSSGSYAHMGNGKHVKDIGAAFAELASFALERAILFEQTRSSERNLRGNIKSLQLLNEIGMDLVSDLNLAAIIHKVVRYTAEILEADAAVINIADKTRENADSVYFYNMPPGTDELLSTRGTLARTVFKNPRQVLINDYPGYPGAIEEFVRAGLSSVMMVPVVSRGVVLATLSAVSFNHVRRFSVEEFEQLELVARHVAIAIENAMLYNEQIKTRQQIEAYADQLRLLNEVAQGIIQEKNSMNMATQLAKGARLMLDCTAASVLLVRPGSDKSPMMAWSMGDENFATATAKGFDFATRDGLCNEMYRSKRPIRLDDVAGDPRYSGLPDGHIELRGFLGVPLIDSGNEFIGQVMLTGKNGDASFTKTDEELLLALCVQVAIAIEKAEAYERQHRIAETLQQAILAVPTHLPGVKLGIAYESAAEATKVGGDFYDLFELKHGCIGVLIGDVSGKGLEAATITSMVKSTIRAFAYKGLSPAEVLSEANKVIYEQLRWSQFVTMTFGIIDVQAQRFIASRAGHPEIVIGRGNRCEFCESESNLPLGIMSDMEYEQDEIELFNDDLLILYTDGLIEAKCDNKILGDDCMLEKINETFEGKDAQQLAREIVNIAKEFTGSRLEDDIAIVTLRLELDTAVGD